MASGSLLATLRFAASAGLVEKSIADELLEWINCNFSPAASTQAESGSYYLEGLKVHEALTVYVIKGLVRVLWFEGWREIRLG